MVKIQIDRVAGEVLWVGKTVTRVLLGVAGNRLLYTTDGAGEAGEGGYW